jgi:calcineurin-like phosphoesterase
MTRETAMVRFLTGMPARMEAASENPRLQAVLIDADEATGQAVAIEHLDWSLDDVARARRESGDGGTD